MAQTNEKLQLFLLDENGKRINPGFKVSACSPTGAKRAEVRRVVAEYQKKNVDIAVKLEMPEDESSLAAIKFAKDDPARARGTFDTLVAKADMGDEETIDLCRTIVDADSLNDDQADAIALPATSDFWQNQDLIEIEAWVSRFRGKNGV